jgi:hypothetical protein
MKDRIYLFYRAAIAPRARNKEEIMRRLKELVHYICDRCKDEPGFGATKLNKILWYLDTFTFLKSGRPFSGNTKYVRREHGPAPHQILVVLRALETDKSILIQESKYYNHVKTDYVVLRPPKKSIFTADEKELIDEISQAVCRRTAKEISDLTHDNVWEAAEEGEEIPLYAILAKPDKITLEDKEWLRDVVVARHS